MVIHTITVNGVEHALFSCRNGAYVGLIIQHSLGVQLTETLHTLYSRNLVHLAKIACKMNIASIGCNLLRILKHHCSLLAQIVTKESDNF